MPWKFFIRLTTYLLIIWTVFAYTFFITIISNLNCFFPYFLYYNHLARQVSTRSDCSSAEKTKLQQTTWLNFMFYPSMHACFIYCLYYSIKHDYIFFKHYNQSSSFSILYIIHLCKEKEGKNYTTNCKNFVLTEYTHDFQQGWSVMKWVWSLWYFSKRNSINWVDIIFGGSHWSFCREMPWIPRIEVVLNSWLGFFTITVVYLAAIWLLADC